MAKKILFVITKESVFLKPYYKAFRDYGCDVKIFDPASHPLFSNPFSKRASQKLRFLKLAAIRKINENLLKAVSEYKPDFLFAAKAPLISPRTIEKIGKMGVKTISWYAEYIWDWDIIKKIAPVYDYFFSPDRYSMNLLKKEGVLSLYYLPHAAEIEEIEKTCKMLSTEKKFLYNVAFVGIFDSLLYPNRENCLDKLKDMGLHIWGNKKWLESSLRDYYQGETSGAEMMNIYRKSKIIISIHYDKEPADAISLRPFEAASAGRFFLSDRARKDIFNLFEDGKEFVSFADADDLKKKVSYYLLHEKEREKVALAAFKRVSHDSTYQDRVKEIFRIVGY